MADGTTAFADGDLYILFKLEKGLIMRNLTMLGAVTCINYPSRPCITNAANERHITKVGSMAQNAVEHG